MARRINGASHGPRNLRPTLGALRMKDLVSQLIAGLFDLIVDAAGTHVVIEKSDAPPDSAATIGMQVLIVVASPAVWAW